MQRNTGETWSEGRMDRASSAARRVCSGVRPEGSEGSSSSPSVAGMRGWHRLSRKERQTHWSWTYWATILPHPWQDDDSSKKLKDPRHHATLPQPSLRVFHMWHTVLTKGTQTLWSVPSKTHVVAPRSAGRWGRHGVPSERRHGPVLLLGWEQALALEELD